MTLPAMSLPVDRPIGRRPVERPPLEGSPPLKVARSRR
jgi:hypothetical protein